MSIFKTTLRFLATFAVIAAFYLAAAACDTEQSVPSAPSYPDKDMGHNVTSDTLDSGLPRNIKSSSASQV